MIYYRWMIEWRSATGAGNYFVVGATEKEARWRFSRIFPHVDIEKVESRGEVESK